MFIRIRSTGEVVDSKQYLIDNPEVPKVLTSDLMNSLGIDPVMGYPKPPVSDPLKKAKVIGATYEDGLYFEQWGIVDRFERESVEYFKTLYSTIQPKILEYCNNLLGKLISEYPEREISTWEIQIREANAYSVDNTVSTPFINSAKHEEETVAEYASIILGNELAYAQAAGSIVNTRRSLERELEQATTVDELELLLSKLTY